jgi:hypothetical protein
MEELDINRDGYMEVSYLVFLKEGGMVGNQADCKFRLIDK